MTQDEIIRMAREAGIVVDMNGEFFCGLFNLERFAALVVAHEREKQAKQEPVAWIKLNEDGVYIEDVTGFPVYAAPVRTKDLTEPLIDELRECRDLLMCVESCSRNNFENLAYERVQAIDEVIAADRRKNK